MFFLALSRRSLEGWRPRLPQSGACFSPSARTRRPAFLQRMQPRGLLHICLAALTFAVWATVARAEGTTPAVASTALVAAAGSAAVVVASPAPPAPMSGMPLHQAWQFGGWSMWVLAALAAAGVALLIRQLSVFREQRVVPRGLLAELLDRIHAGELNEARRLCEDRPCPLSSSTLKTFDHLRQAPKSGLSLLRDTVWTERALQADAMRSQAQLLLEIAVLALLFGLLGTVLDLLQFFADLAQGAAPQQARGILQALVTSAFGLLIAIPGLVCYFWMRRRVARRIAALESAAAEVVMAVTGRFGR